MSGVGDLSLVRFQNPALLLEYWEKGTTWSCKQNKLVIYIWRTLTSWLQVYLSGHTFGQELRHFRAKLNGKTTSINRPLPRFQDTKDNSETIVLNLLVRSEYKQGSTEHVSDWLQGWQEIRSLIIIKKIIILWIGGSCEIWKCRLLTALSHSNKPPFARMVCNRLLSSKVNCRWTSCGACLSPRPLRKNSSESVIFSFLRWRGESDPGYAVSLSAERCGEDLRDVYLKIQTRGSGIGTHGSIETVGAWSPTGRCCVSAAGLKCSYREAGECTFGFRLVSFV